jgi:hypothetical protein
MSRIRIVVVGLAVLASACESVESFFSAAPISGSGQTAASQPASMRVDQACPAWSTLQACVFDDTAYAVARTKVSGKLSMAVDAAGRRARLALLGREPKDETLSFTGTLLPAWAKCGDEVLVLASGPKGNANLPTCASAPALGAPPLAVCPAWTAGLLSKHERGFSGVGMSEGIEEPAFAVKSAENRARAKLVEAVNLQLIIAGGGINAQSSGTTSDTQTLASITCAGITFARVAGAASADPVAAAAQAEAAAARPAPAPTKQSVDKARAAELAKKETLKKYHAYLLATHAAELKHQKAMTQIAAQCGSNLPLCLQLQKKNKDVQLYRAKSIATKKKLKLSDEAASDLRGMWSAYLADAKQFAEDFGDATAALFAAAAPAHTKLVGLTR